MECKHPSFAIMTVALKSMINLYNAYVLYILRNPTIAKTINTLISIKVIMVTKIDECKAIVELCKAFDDIVYMAIRYGSNRHTAAPGIIRDACEVRARYNDYVLFELKNDNTLNGPDVGAFAVPSDNLKDLIEKYRKVQK